VSLAEQYAERGHSIQHFQTSADHPSLQRRGVHDRRGFAKSVALGEVHHVLFAIPAATRYGVMMLRHARTEQGRRNFNRVIELPRYVVA
jgi:hypothetical protein